MKTPVKNIGPYEVERKLGVGGMAEVFLARKPMGPGGYKRVVIKRMLPHLAEDERFVQMFLREAAIHAQLNHANVVQIFDMSAPAEAGDLYIAMEYLEGINVLELATRSWRAHRPLPLELVLRIVSDAARGLDYVHRRALVHRDVAPDNLFFVVGDGTVKLLDFGVARGGKAKVLTSKGELKGKIPFMAPEALEGLELDGRADLFSLGVTAYWLFTGKKPFPGAKDVDVVRAILRSDPIRPSAHNHDIPLWLEALLLGMLVKDRAARIQTGAEIDVEISRKGRLDRANDVAFVEELLALPDSQLTEKTDPIPAALRAPSDVFARVDTSQIHRLRLAQAPPQADSLAAPSPLLFSDTDNDEDRREQHNPFDPFDAPPTTHDPVPEPISFGQASSAVDRRAVPPTPMPRAAVMEIDGDAARETDDPSSDTLRLTESQINKGRGG